MSLKLIVSTLQSEGTPCTVESCTGEGMTIFDGEISSLTGETANSGCFGDCSALSKLVDE